MFYLAGIVDIICGPYEHCPQWKEMKMSDRMLDEVGAAYRETTFIVFERNGEVIDYQPLEVENGRLHIYLNPLQEPVTGSMLDDLRRVLHTAALVEKDAVYAVVEVQYAAEDIRADAVALEIPEAAIKDNPTLRESFGAIFDHAKAHGLTPIIAMPYTEECMSQMLPQGFKILDYMYAL